MVVVLCENYRDAEEAFRAWLGFLLTPPSDEISNVDKYSLRVETSDGQCYIFIDYRFKNVFSEKTNMIQTIDEFLDWHWIDDPDPYRREYRRKVNDEKDKD